MRFRSERKIRGKIESLGKLKADEGYRERNENRETNPTALKQLNFVEQAHGRIIYHTENDLKSRFRLNPISFLVDSFLERNVKTPLEIIYEDWDGEEAEEELLGEETAHGTIDKFPLSLYYAEKDSDSSSECRFRLTGKWDSQESFYLAWEKEKEEEDREGLIEIAFDIDDAKKTNVEFDDEEENLIEIDISRTRYDKFPTKT